MEKEQNTNNEKTPETEKGNINSSNNDSKKIEEKNDSEKIEKKEVTSENKILELEDKLTRTFAEMENQRRRFEKEKEDAFDYGGFAFAK